jgi:hypothetical protein
MADGDEQKSSGEVVERGKQQECGAREGIEEKRCLLSASPS